MMLHRVIYVSEIAAPGSFSTAVLADIMGAAVANNRRDHITSGMLVHQGHVIHVIEGARVDVDRLMRRLTTDARHRNLRVLSDTPIAARRMLDALCLCRDPEALLARAGLKGLDRVGANDAERMIEMRRAA